jgi:steroid 5-alpha reductase family enzyme
VLFAVNTVVIYALALLLWRVAVRTNDPSFIDVCWGAGFVVLALVSYALSPHRLVLALVAAVWGLRLASYLFWRWRKNGPDARYVAMLKRADDPAQYMLTRVFLLQATLLLIVSLPLQLGQVYDGHFTTGNLVGVVIAVIGIAFESTGDFQLTRFKSDPANHGHVMDRGLWRYTRHPNYFGDFCVWWGLFIMSVVNPVTVVGVIGPLVMSVLLMRYSGVGPLESQLHRTKPKYADYVRRTSAFFPAPPKTIEAGK